MTMDYYLLGILLMWGIGLIAGYLTGVALGRGDA